MAATVLLRATGPRVLGAAMVATAAVGLLALVSDGPGAVVAWAAPLVLFALVGWTAFWRPHVEVSDGGVRVVNTLRTVEVAWPAVQEVDGRYGLRLLTSYGAVQAWGAQAPTGRGRGTAPDSEASAAVRAHWERLRAQGHLDGARLEQPELPVRWHAGTVVALVVAGVATVVSLLLH